VLWVLDHDVTAVVGVMLRRERHRCVTVGEVGLARASFPSTVRRISGMAASLR
jgi:hypothetical protein